MTHPVCLQNCDLLSGNHQVDHQRRCQGARPAHFHRQTRRQERCQGKDEKVQEAGEGVVAKSAAGGSINMVPLHFIPIHFLPGYFVTEIL
jgi:hypothetical protein